MYDSVGFSGGESEHAHDVSAALERFSIVSVLL